MTIWQPLRSLRYSRAAWSPTNCGCTEKRFLESAAMRSDNGGTNKNYGPSFTALLPYRLPEVRSPSTTPRERRGRQIHGAARRSGRPLNWINSSAAPSSHWRSSCMTGAAFVMIGWRMRCIVINADAIFAPRHTAARNAVTSVLPGARNCSAMALDFRMVKNSRSSVDGHSTERSRRPGRVWSGMDRVYSHRGVDRCLYHRYLVDVAQRRTDVIS